MAGVFLDILGVIFKNDGIIAKVLEISNFLILWYKTEKMYKFAFKKTNPAKIWAQICESESLKGQNGPF